MLSAWASGRRVFWRSSTPVCYPSNETHWGLETASVNAMLSRSDALVEEALHTERGLPRGAIIDVRGIDVADLAVARCAGADVDEKGKDAVAVRTVRHALACRCKHYGGDRTMLHPDPEFAMMQMRALLRRMSNTCDA